MRYYVLAGDGNKYGPADVSTLNQWISEGRLMPTQMLEDEASGAQMVASSVAGLNFPAPGPAAQPGPYQNPPQANYYARGVDPMYGDNGQKDLTTAWICGAVGLLCCAPVAIAGLISANKAKAKGNPGATGAVILNWIVIGIWIGGTIFFIVGGGFMARR